MIINAAVIGTGVGLHHIKAIDETKNAKVSIICEKNTKRINLLKKKFPQKIITFDENQIFTNKNINLVSIASYDDDHYSQILKSIKSNKNIISEKPMCLNLMELKKINKLLKSSKLYFTSNLVLQENQLFKSFKKKIYKKDIYYLEADYLWGRKNKLNGWRSSVKDYSVTLGAGIHVIDIVMWLIDKNPISVFSYASRKGFLSKKFKKNSFYVYLLKFENGIIAKITANGPCAHNHFHELKIFEKNKTLVNSYLGAYMIKKNNMNFKLEYIKNQYPDKLNRSKLIKNFIERIIKKKSNKKVIKKNIDLMSVCFACDESIKQKKEIKIKYLN